MAVMLLPKLHLDDARPRGYDSPKLFRSDTLIRIKALTAHVRDEMRFIEELKRQIHKTQSG